MPDWEVPYLTEDLPGVGGEIRANLTDFMVDEIPAYEPCGYGEHTYFRVEKRGISTMMLMKEIAQQLHLSTRDISCAGLKDTTAVARQTLCVHNIEPATIQALTLESAEILWVSRHTNKLRTGHLKGNHFNIRIRGVGPDAKRRADPILEILAQRGVPNAYGAQRFGNRGDNHVIGEYLVRGDREGLAAHGVRRPSFKLKSLFVSAYQSYLFNQLLACRIRNGTLDGVIEGDIARKEETGGLFTVTDVAVDNARVQAWEITATGPIYGYKMMQAAGIAGEIESRLLAEHDLSPQSFRGVKAKGSRRPLRYRPEGLAWSQEDSETLVIDFTAPKGSFATILLDELMKRQEGTASLKKSGL